MKNKFICTSLASAAVLSSMSSGNFEKLFLNAEAAESSENSKTTVERLRNGIEISNYKQATQIIVTFSLNGDEKSNFSNIAFKIEDDKLEKIQNDGIKDTAIFYEDLENNILRVTLKDEYMHNLKKINCTIYSIEGEQNSEFIFGPEYDKKLNQRKEEAIQELKDIGLPEHILKVKTEQINDAVSIEEIDDAVKVAKEIKEKNDEKLKDKYKEQSLINKKEAAKDIIDKLSHISDERKEELKNIVEEAKTPNEVDDTLTKAFDENEKNKNQSLRNRKEAVNDIIDKLSNLSDARKKELERDVKEAKTPDEVDTLLTKALDENEENKKENGKFVGKDRYDTAIRVSKDRFSNKKADSVVIVGGDSIIDGLSASPLASAYNAPILLAQKSGIDKTALDEINRVCGNMKNKEVYIIGGKSSVPASVTDQLRKAFPGVVVKRLEGSSRYETSLNVAKYLAENKKVANRVFVVGGYGESDAMSIAPVAMDKSDKTLLKNTVDPILVVNKDAIDANSKQLLADYAFKSVTVIGGVNTVSPKAMSDIESISSIGANGVKRVSGENRYDTNLSILKNFYSSNDEQNKILMRGLIVASGNKDKLVDAQTASILTSDINRDMPIMLVGDTIANSQINYLIDNKNSLSKNIRRVGGSVSEKVMKILSDRLGI
ncbi:cell wall-binding repeat-containing protein [Peptostreptococcus sp. D1]|uniref:cell wall-binding repeat-containing protein n=1 Tax=Peptostreptococcus sp. D1 TaxID=72304 RepID=UPI0008E5B620|nr:cell wall-binding repeat-containing protein [Peptostreptococcus sp. D1]SFE85833.1 GA module [Peptostreptococcus sp. D1]